MKRVKTQSDMAAAVAKLERLEQRMIRSQNAWQKQRKLVTTAGARFEAKTVGGTLDVRELSR